MARRGYADGGTCSCNLAPLCRHHHLLKTHTAWAYRRIDPTRFLWTDPFGHHYLSDRGRTTVVPPGPGEPATAPSPKRAVSAA